MPWEETENVIATRLRDPADFQDGTFRTLILKKDKPRVYGIVAKPKDGGGMTLQALRFPKEDGWTMATAKRWVAEHNVKCVEGLMANVETKDLTLKVKTVGESGVFEGYAAVFGNVDLGGDVIMNGAFAKHLNDRGGSVPVFWEHKNLIGRGLDVTEDQHGLYVKAELNLETQPGREAYSFLKQGAVTGLSIGYTVPKGKFDYDSEGHRILREIRLHEFSLTPIPMNPAAIITAVKTNTDGPGEEENVIDFAGTEIKAGRRLSAETLARLNEVMRIHQDAMDKIKALMETDGTTPETGAGKSSAPDEPPVVPAEPAPDHSGLIDQLNQLKEAFHVR